MTLVRFGNVSFVQDGLAWSGLAGLDQRVGLSISALKRNSRVRTES